MRRAKQPAGRGARGEDWVEIERMVSRPAPRFRNGREFCCIWLWGEGRSVGRGEGGEGGAWKERLRGRSGRALDSLSERFIGGWAVQNGKSSGGVGALG